MRTHRIETRDLAGHPAHHGWSIAGDCNGLSETRDQVRIIRKTSRTTEVRVTDLRTRRFVEVN